MTITQGKENKIFKDTQTKFYINNYLRFDNNIVTPIISKCACSTLAALANNYSIDDVYKPIIWGGIKRYSINDVKSYTKFAVIRNPLERIESAYNTIGNKMSVSDYIDSVVETLSTLDNIEIDRHIASQFIFYNIDDIDIFVPIEKLNDYLKSIGINPIKINCSKSPIKINDARLNNLLKQDFEIYNVVSRK